MYAVWQSMHRTSTMYHDDSANTESCLVYAVWRASHKLQQYHSVLLGSYILVTGHSFIHLQKIKDFKADTYRLPVFITMVSSCQACPVFFLTVYGVLWMYTALCHSCRTVNACAVSSSC